ncbi:hypothetical protein J6590_025598 [Homalodisca vitripennis]|nr:hypothetical protein J6590_025598 [Homalodisca vitripennis]
MNELIATDSPSFTRFDAVRPFSELIVHYVNDVDPDCPSAAPPFIFELSETKTKTRVETLETVVHHGPIGPNLFHSGRISAKVL